MKKIKIVLCVLLAATTAFCFTSCKSGKKDETTTLSTTKSAVTQSQTETSNTYSQEQTETTASTAPQNSTTEKKTEKKTSTTKNDTEDNSPVSVNQALDILSNNYYGKKYDVNATVKEGDFQYFAVYDKNSVKYASVKVNLKTSQAVETVVDSSSDPYEFNLNSYAE